MTTANIALISLFGHLARSAAFVPPPSPAQVGNGATSPLRATPLPLILGAPDEALAVAMALCAREEMSNASNSEERRPPIPPAQPVAHFDAPAAEGTHQRSRRMTSETVSSFQNSLLYLGPSLENYEKILAHSLQLLSRIAEGSANAPVGDPMLHASIDFGCDEGARQMQSLSLVRDSFSFVGLHLKPPKASADGFIMTRDEADLWGNRLHTLLEEGPPAAVTMDVRTHLAMLQANSLPKTKGVLGKNDVWAISDMIQDGFHVDNGGLLAGSRAKAKADPTSSNFPCPETAFVKSGSTKWVKQTSLECDTSIKVGNKTGTAGHPTMRWCTGCMRVHGRFYPHAEYLRRKTLPEYTCKKCNTTRPVDNGEERWKKALHDKDCRVTCNVCKKQMRFTDKFWTPE